MGVFGGLGCVLVEVVRATLSWQLWWRLRSRGGRLNFSTLTQVIFDHPSLIIKRVQHFCLQETAVNQKDRGGQTLDCWEGKLECEPVHCNAMQCIGPFSILKAKKPRIIDMTMINA